MEEIVRKAPPRRRLPESRGRGEEGGSDGEGSEAEGVWYL